MPFVTKSGGFQFDDGVVLTHKDNDGKIIQGNGLQVKVLANIGVTGLDQESEEFKLAVIRGNPKENGTSWATTPVFIIQHYDFDKETWERFLAKYEKQLQKPTPSFIYEPTVYDIIDVEYGRRAFPLWVVEYLEEKGTFDIALKERKMESMHYKLNETQLKLIKEAISNRKKLEALKEEPKQEIPEDPKKKKVV